MGKKALILRGGTMKGAFIAGVLRVFHEKLGADYFDAIYSNSVGVFEQAFYAANQPEIMEDVWVNHVHGKKLIDFSNIVRGIPILKLDYLVDLLKSETSKLDTLAIIESKPELFCNVTDYETKEPHLVNLKEENVFDVMKATSALPILYNRKVFINGKRYIDGSLSMKRAYIFILEKLQNDRFEEIIVVVNKRGLLNSDAPSVKILEPSSMPLRHWLDTNQERIRATITQGKEDAEEFIKNKLQQTLIR